MALRRSATAVVGQGGLNFDMLTQQCVERNPGPAPLDTPDQNATVESWRVKIKQMMMRSHIYPVREEVAEMRVATAQQPNVPAVWRRSTNLECSMTMICRCNSCARVEQQLRGCAWPGL